MTKPMELVQQNTPYKHYTPSKMYNLQQTKHMHATYAFISTSYNTSVIQ